MAAPVIQFKRGLLANLPGLRAGEPGFTTDSYDLYVGLTSETSTNKFFGSYRYWTKETTSTGSGLNLVEGTSNGSNFITLKSPDSLAGIVTYTFPGTDGTNGQVLATNGSGTLSFIDAAANLDIAGDSGTDTIALLSDTLTFAGTANEIETSVTNNEVQIGLPNDVTIGNDLTVTGALTANGNVTIGNAGSDLLTVVGVATFTTSNVYIDNQLYVGGIQIVGTATETVIGDDVTTRNLSVTGISTITGLIDGNGGLDITGHSELDNVNVSGIITATSVVFGSGTAITSVDTDLSSVSASDDTLASAKAIKSYIDTQVTAQDLDFAGDSGTGAVDLDSQSLTIAGTANEIETSASGQTLTVGLPNAVTVTTSLTTPTVKATNLQANDGTTAITITDSTGAVATNSDLTVGGNLYVNGSTTQVNTTSLTVEDSLIEVGRVNGAAPSSDLNIDLGILFNYYTDSAKKSAVYWDDSASRIVLASDVSESTSVLTASAYAALEIGSLWVNDCAGQSQVINCANGVRTLENITIDGGSF